MFKNLKNVFLLGLVMLLVSCGKNDVEGKWNCDVVNVGRVTFNFSDEGTVEILENGASLGVSRYVVQESGNIQVIDPDGSTFILTRNKNGSINFRNGNMSGYFVKE